MNIAVTGGSGRIGSAVVALLREHGHAVRSIDKTKPAQPHKDVEYIVADLTKPTPFKRALKGCDGLVHLAAIVSPRGMPQPLVHNVNVVASFNALWAAAENGIKRVCQASSINAIGSAFSRAPRYDYFPIDEHHPTYNEEAYSLSKWLCEQQADAFARRYEDMKIASLRFHWVVPSRDVAMTRTEPVRAEIVKHLWAYTRLDAAARACMLSLTSNFGGHEAFFIVAPDTATEQPSRKLAREHYPSVPIRGKFAGHASFFTSRKAERMLGWKHDV